MAQKIQGGVIVTGPGEPSVVLDVFGSHYETGFKFNTIPFGGMTIDAKNAVRIGSAADIKLVPPSGFTVILGTTGSLPTAASALRGALFAIQAASGTPDVAYLCQKNAADAYTFQKLLSSQSLALDFTSGNRETLTSAAYSAGTLTVSPNKLVHFFSVNDATAYNISRIVGSGGGFVAGQQCILIAKQAGTGQVTMTDANTSANVNDIHFRANAAPTVLTTKMGVLGTFIYGDPVGAGVNEWWEALA